MPRQSRHSRHSTAQEIDECLYIASPVFPRLQLVRFQLLLLLDTTMTFPLLTLSIPTFCLFCSSPGPDPLLIDRP
jgi:hypothetical protein